MEFQKDKPIYLQIADYMKRKILKSKWEVEERIPSIRDMAVRMEVNPNTVARAYSQLQEKGIIFNKRGIGYFVQKRAQKEIRDQKKEEFFTEILPKFYKKMKMLEISFDEVKENMQNMEINEDEDEIIQ